MSIINMMGGPTEFAKLFGGGSSSPTGSNSAPTYCPPTYYECSKHGWYGDISRCFTCPSCELNIDKFCNYCKKTFKFVNIDQLLTVHNSVRKPTISDHNRIVRKYSKGQTKVIYFCSGSCYQLYEKNKTSCILS